VRGYGNTSYGEAFADVYDAWYPGVSDIDATVALMQGLAGDGGRVLELGVGTGRLAIPMARSGLRVVGVDASAAMLERLRTADPHGLVEVVEGDMVTDLPDGPFDAALIAYNTLFNLTADGEQQRCFEAVASGLRPGGMFVVEAFVPDEPFRDGEHVRLRSMSADQVVLSVEVYDAARQTAEGHFVELNHGERVTLRPWSIRYATVPQLDAMASAAGLSLAERWGAVDRSPFDGAQRHVSVYRR
jgi:SAM-dependent methyltransferase